MKVSEAEQCDYLLARAERMLGVGDAGGASDLCNGIIGKYPEHIPCRLIHARALLDMGRAEEAMETLNAADLYGRMSSGEMRVEMKERHLLLRAEILGRLCRKDEAAEVLEAVLKSDKSNRWAMEALGALWMDNGRVKEAMEIYERLTAEGLNDGQLCRCLGEGYELTGRGDKALAIYEGMRESEREEGTCDIEELNGDEEEAAMGVMEGGVTSLRIARLYRQSGRMLDSMVEYDRLMERLPGDVMTACEAASVAVEMGDDCRVVKYLNGALKSVRSDLTALTMLAEQHIRCGRFVEAGWLWWRLWRMDVEDGRAIAGVIVCAIVSGHDGLSDRMLAEFGERWGVEEGRELLGGMWRLAVPGMLLDDLMWRRRHPASAEVLPRLLEETAESIRDEMEEDDDRADIHYHLALCYMGSEERELASASLDRALRINGGYVDAARMRVELLLSDENYAAGEAVIERMSVIRSSEAMLDLELALYVLCDREEKAVEQLFGVIEDEVERDEMMTRVGDCLQMFNEQAQKRWVGICRRHIRENVPDELSEAA